MKKRSVVIIDYDLGNLFSVQLACEAIGLSVEITRNKKALEDADAIILPGVGSFADAMSNLESMDLISPLHDFVTSGKPLMGVCLGMQLLFTKSEEFGDTPGLDMIHGEIRKLKTSDNEPVKVPQIGWNTISTAGIPWQATPLKSIPANSYMYFVHSYYAIPLDNRVTLTTTKYGDNVYCSGVFKDNIFATQFHPEKSTEVGVKIYKDWAMMNNLI